MMGKLSKFLALPEEEKRIFVSALFLLPLLSAALRVFRYQRLRAVLEGPPRAGRKPIGIGELATLGRAVNSAANYALGQPTCLTRSMLLCWLLRRRGIATQLRIGVKLDDGKLDAHAWVEHEGVPINDAEDVAQRFAPFDEPVSNEAFS